MSHQKKRLQTSKFYVAGLHCSACEILIEKRLIKEDFIDIVDVSQSKNTLTISHFAANPITVEFLNNIFSSDGYHFSTRPFSQNQLTVDTCPVDTNPNIYKSILIALSFLVAFVLLGKTGFSSLVSVNSTSGLPVFFAFGLLAGFSSCAALVGGIILSLSKQWTTSYSKNNSTVEKLEPHFLFNAGRLISYSLLGAVLGTVGNVFRLSPLISAGLVVAVSVLMIVLGLQMLGIKYFQRFQIRLPKSLTSRAADESNFTGRFAPVLMGALTFFLPCGFTITAQALALASGSPLQGAAIMGLFALGTLPGLLLIGLSSVKFYSNPRLSSQFSTIAGLIVLFFALFNINAQLAVLGAPNLNSILTTSVSADTSTNNSNLSDLPPIVDGKQIIKMDASSTGYAPNAIKARAGVPIRWEITDRGTSGCTNAVLARSLFDGQIDLVPGTTSVKEFTVANAGTYRFSCWMGMVSGTFTIVDDHGNSGNPNAVPVASGAKGCGCGGGGATGGSCH